jgi:outer membrane receptor protein involved in Fe transport
MIAEIQSFLPDYNPAPTDAVSYYELHGVPWYQIQANPALADSIASVSDVVAMNDSRSYNLLSKFTTRPTTQTKLQYSLLLDGSERTSFSFAYRFNPDGLPTVRDRSVNHSLHWTHTLGDRAFYTLRTSYARNNFHVGVYEDPYDPRYVPDLSGIGDGPVLGLPSSNFNFAGNAKGQTFERATSLRGRFDFTRQFGVRHEAKFGLDVQHHSLERENFTVLYNQDRYLSPTVENINTASRDKYGCTEFFDVPAGVDYFYPLGGRPEGAPDPAETCEPQTVLELSAYAQDKIEFDDFIVNVGLRYERFEPNGVYIPDLLALDDYVLVDDGADPSDLLPLEESEVKNLLLPRLGISFPITERGIIHFSYGHFAQMPRLRNMYRNPELEFPANSVPTFGNSNMRPERTVQYEIGLQQQLTDGLAFTVTGYFKDIRDYLALQRIQYSTIAGQNEYRIYRNRDYANIKGITFSLTKRRAPGGLLSATLDYTYQVAEGNDDRPDAFFFNALSGRETEFEVVPLDFDQTSVLSGTVSLSKPGNWGISFIGQFATGYPYSPQLIFQNLDLASNSDNKPNLLTLDMRANKQVSLGASNLTLFAQAYNLLDIINQPFVFNDTGTADYTLNGGNNPHEAWEAYYGLPGIQTLDTWNTRPHWYSSPRSLRLGFILGF